MKGKTHRIKSHMRRKPEKKKSTIEKALDPKSLKEALR